MGGNALKETFTRRYDREEYFDLCQEVCEKLRTKTDNKISVLQAYNTKPSFGDMDVLIESENINYKELIINLFQPNQIKKNGNVYSFDVKELQIDLIVTPTDQFYTSLNYFAWNDLGNLMGRIFKKMGFKYGHKGLFYIVRDGDYILKEIPVSLDSEQIFNFADYDYSRFCEGFDTLREMFEYVTTSKYFNKDIFLLHNRNHRSRVRDAKRPSYNAFLKFCEDTNNTTSFAWKSKLTMGKFYEEKETTIFLEKAFNYFEGFKEKHEEAVIELKRNTHFKNKFSGEIVMYLTGLHRKELGQFMQNIRLNNKDLKDFIIESNTQEVTDFILEEFEKYKSLI